MSVISFRLLVVLGVAVGVVLGVGGIPYTIKEMQIEKMVVIRSDERSM